jgi:hypothetical protein
MAWYIAITAVLFVPPIFLVLIPLVLCPQLASIFDVADLQTISAALTVLLAYICALTFLYGTFQYRFLNFTIGVNSFCSIYFLSPIPCAAPTIWFIPAPPIVSSHPYLAHASQSVQKPNSPRLFYNFCPWCKQQIGPFT